MANTNKVKVRILRNLGSWQAGEVVSVSAETAESFSVWRDGKAPRLEILQKKRTQKQEQEKAESDNPAPAEKE